MYYVLLLLLFWVNFFFCFRFLFSFLFYVYTLMIRIYDNPSLRNYNNYDNFRIIGNLFEYLSVIDTPFSFTTQIRNVVCVCVVFVCVCVLKFVIMCFKIRDSYIRRNGIKLSILIRTVNVLLNRRTLFGNTNRSRQHPNLFVFANRLLICICLSCLIKSIFII